MLKKNPGKTRKSLLPPGFVPFAEREQQLKNRILTDVRSIVLALSQGPEAPDIPTLVDAARRLALSLQAQVRDAFGVDDHFNALKNLVSETDMTLRNELETVASFSAALLACVRYRPVRR